MKYKKIQKKRQHTAESSPCVRVRVPSKVNLIPLWETGVEGLSTVIIPFIGL